MDVHLTIIKRIRQIIFRYLPFLMTVRSEAEWIRKIPNKDMKVTKNSRVCINHFEEKDIKRFVIFKRANGDPDIKVNIYW